MRSVLTIVCTLVFSGCAFVQVSEAGAGVTQASATDVANCTEVGVVESTTQARVLLERGSAKVKQELIDLARNQAAGMGANAIVPIGEPVDGKQSFRAYKCESF